jgi:hypothetical protein
MAESARRPSWGRRELLALEIVTAVAAVLGGALLVIVPSGGLLHAEPAALSNGPFTSWRLPGALLMTLVGGGFAVAAAALVRHWPHAAWLSVAAGFGLIVFEGFEVAWLGYQTLEAVFAVIGAMVVLLAARERHLPP